MKRSVSSLSSPTRSSRTALPALLILLGGLAAAGAACSSSQATPTGTTKTPVVPEDSGVAVVTDAGASADASDDGGDAAPAPPQAFLRVAQLSPDMGPIDLCIAPHGTTTFIGPLVAALAGAGAASPTTDDAGEGDGAAEDAGAGDAGASEDAGPAPAPPGIDYAQISAYFSVDIGQYDVRIVPAGATSCDTAVPQLHVLLAPDGGEDDAGLSDAGSPDASAPDASFDASPPPGDAAAPVDAGGLDATADAATPVDSGTGGPGLPDTKNLPALAFNTYSTLLVVGDTSPTGSDKGVKVTILADDAVLSGGTASLRAVNAVPSAPSLDFGAGSFATPWLPFFVGVDFGAVSTTAAPNQGVVDTNGYLAIDPASVKMLSARASSDATADTALASNVSIEPGSIVSVFAVGGKTGDTAQPASLLVCMDNQPSGGLLSDCSIAQ